MRPKRFYAFFITTAILCMAGHSYASKTPNAGKDRQAAAAGQVPGNAGDVSAKSSDFHRQLEKIEVVFSREKGQDKKAVNELDRKIRPDLEQLSFDEEIVPVLKDKSKDWRLRMVIIKHLTSGFQREDSSGGKVDMFSKIPGMVEALSSVLLDSSEHDEVRIAAVNALSEPARHNAKAREALAKAVKDKTLPASVLEHAMATVGASGMDDIDTIIELIERKPQKRNDVGINLNAIRALGKSKDPRAVGLLFKLFDESAPDSFFQMTVLGEFSHLTFENPENQEKLRPMLVPRLLKLLDDRSRIGASRQTAARLLARMKVKEAVEPIMKWFLPEKEGGGGYE